MRDAASPQIDVGQQGLDGIAGEIAHAAPVGVGISRDGVGLCLLQVVDAAFQHDAGCRLRNIAILVATHIGFGDVGHVTEVAHQVEIAQRAQRQHLRAMGQVVALGVRRVFVHHLSGFLQHDVAVVDDTVERCPCGKLIVGLCVAQINLDEVFHRGSGDRGCRNQLVGAKVAPDDEPQDD